MTDHQMLRNIPMDSRLLWRTVAIPIDVEQLNTEIQESWSNVDLTSLNRFLSPSNSFEMQVKLFSGALYMISLSKTFPRQIDEPYSEYYCNSERNWRMFNCWTSKKTLQSLEITDGHNMIMVVYNPISICRSNKNRILDIIVPKMGDRIGWIETDGAVCNSKIYVCGNPVPFTMKQMDHPDTPFYVPILDGNNLIVGTGRASLWRECLCGLVKGYSRFQFSIGDFDPQTKAVLLAALSMMVYERRGHFKLVLLFVLIAALTFFLIELAFDLDFLYT